MKIKNEKLLKLVILLLTISIPVDGRDITKDVVFVSPNIGTAFSVSTTDNGSGMNFSGTIDQAVVIPFGQTNDANNYPWAIISNGDSAQSFEMTYTSTDIDAPSWLKVNNVNDMISASTLNKGETKSIPGGTNVAPNSYIKLYLWTTYSGITIGDKLGMFIVNGSSVTPITPAAILAKIQPLLTNENRVNPNTSLVTTQGKRGPIYIYKLPGTDPLVLVAQSSGAIDCDGQTTTQCNPNTDPGYQPQTSFEQ